MASYLMSVIREEQQKQSTSVALVSHSCGSVVLSGVVAPATKDVGAIAGSATIGLWDKTRLVIGRGDYHWQHEPCWYAVRKGRTGHWAGDRRQTTVWPIAHQKSETGHGTQKPVECMKRPLENNSSAGQAVYEPFCGSGTTIITAEMTGGSCHAVELSPPTSTSPCSGGKPSQAPSLPRRGRGHFCRGGRLPPR
jgi:hypothetical protein